MIESINFRHEFKYQCSEAQLEIIKSRLQNLLRYDSYVNNGEYSVRSLYFDNLNNQCFYENQNGIDPREKFRIRIYDSNEARISLECKRKERDKTYKEIYVLSKKEFNSIISMDNLNNVN